MGSTVTTGKVIQICPGNIHIVFAKSLLQLQRLAGNHHDFPFPDRQEVIGVIQFVLFFDGNDFNATLSQEIEERT